MCLRNQARIASSRATPPALYHTRLKMLPTGGAKRRVSTEQNYTGVQICTPHSVPEKPRARNSGLIYQGKIHILFKY